MSKPDIRIDHNAERFGGGTFTYGSAHEGYVTTRYGGAFPQPNGTANLVLNGREGPSRHIRGISSYRRAQRLLLQYLKGYNVC